MGSSEGPVELLLELGFVAIFTELPSLDPVDRPSAALDGIIPANPNTPYDMKHVVAEIVDDGEVEDPNTEMAYSDAIKIEPDFEIGEEVSEEVKLIDLGRRAILALRQNLISKIHEHDNTNLYKQFKDLIGDIYTAEVHHVRPKMVVLMDDDGNETEYYFELKIQVDEITNDVSLIVVDFSEEDELAENQLLWESLVSDLKHVIGSV